MAPRDPIARLISELARLPGIGEKTASRLAFYIVRAPDDYAQSLVEAINEVKEGIEYCSVCCNLTAVSPCRICASTRRDPRAICVVEGVPDLLAVERTGEFQGRYHVLHGVLRPLDGIGPDEIRIRELVRRVASSDGHDELEEVIVATNPSTDGETTALYIARLLKPFEIRVTRIASGIPIGGDLEYTDRVTLGRALSGRREL